MEILDFWNVFDSVSVLLAETFWWINAWNYFQTNYIQTIVCVESRNRTLGEHFPITDWLGDETFWKYLRPSEQLWYVQHVSINVWQQFNCKFLFPP